MYQRIRDLREDRDLMQEDIANLLNCTQACYSNYENGKRDIPTEVLNKLADFYGVSTDYLLLDVSNNANKNILNIFNTLNHINENKYDTFYSVVKILAENIDKL